MLFYVLRQIIQQNRMETENDQKYSNEKRQEVIEARKAGLTIAQIAIQTGAGQTTIKVWLKDAVKVKGYKSRVQNSDNPVTPVQQQKI